MVKENNSEKSTLSEGYGEDIVVEPVSEAEAKANCQAAILHAQKINDFLMQQTPYWDRKHPRDRG